MRYIFITGGVVSSVGKGIAAASIGALLLSEGYRVRIRKMDPYLNVDPGTMSPYEHGEVFVTEDGAETDLDLGHYERFTCINSNVYDSISSGQIFNDVIKKERKGEYLGTTVQIIPHITDEIKNRIDLNTDNEDFLICEIGGTVGDIEATPFLEAIRQYYNDKGKDKVLFIHVTLLPYLKKSGELKTKPTQHSIRELQRAGISPNIIICRSEVSLTEENIRKLALFCNVKQQDIIPALDCDSLYQVVINYNKEGLKNRILNHFFGSNLLNSSKVKNKDDNNNTCFYKPLSLWEELVDKEIYFKQTLNLYIIAKYLKSKDAYISLEAALKHSAIANSVKLNINWINAECLENENNVDLILNKAHGILIPGGYGIRGTKGKIIALEYGRINKVPTLGICLGAQLMVIEVLLNLSNLDNVGSGEFGNYKHQVVTLLTEWNKDGSIETRSREDELGGSMRLGSYPCELQKDSLAKLIYKDNLINERHRHRYEIDIKYKKYLEECGMIISGISPDKKLPEIVELINHPFFIGVQFHPEFKSRPFKPHLLFLAFIRAQLKYKLNKCK